MNYLSSDAPSTVLIPNRTVTQYTVVSKHSFLEGLFFWESHVGFELRSRTVVNPSDFKVPKTLCDQWKWASTDGKVIQEDINESSAGRVVLQWVGAGFALTEFISSRALTWILEGSPLVGLRYTESNFILACSLTGLKLQLNTWPSLGGFPDEVMSHYWPVS